MPVSSLPLRACRMPLLFPSALRPFRCDSWWMSVWDLLSCAGCAKIYHDASSAFEDCRGWEDERILEKPAQKGA